MSSLNGNETHSDSEQQLIGHSRYHQQWTQSLLATRGTTSIVTMDMDQSIVAIELTSARLARANIHSLDCVRRRSKASGGWRRPLQR